MISLCFFVNELKDWLEICKDLSTAENSARIPNHLNVKHGRGVGTSLQTVAGRGGSGACDNCAHGWANMGEAFLSALPCRSILNEAYQAKLNQPSSYSTSS